MRPIVDSELPQIQGSRHEAGRHVPDGVIRPGLTVVESSDPEATARRIAAERGGEVKTNLREAQRALKTRAGSLDRERAVARARQALALADRLAPFDEDADDALIARRHELQAAAALAGDMSEHLTQLHRRLNVLHLAYSEAKAAGAALAAAREGLPDDLPPRLDLIAIRHARDLVTAADAELAESQRVLDEAAAVEAAIGDETEPGREAPALAETTARHRSKDARRQSLTLVVRAGLVSVPGVGILTASALGVASPVVGAGLAVATLPPVVELLRRAWTTKAAAQEQVRRAEAHAAEVVQHHLHRLEVARATRHKAEDRLSQAHRRRFDAASRWLQVVGTGVAPGEATAVFERARDLARLQPEADSSMARAERLRRSFERDVAATGAPPELGWSEALAYIDRLAALQPVAASLLESVAEAERRAVQRELLASLVGRFDPATLRRIANRRVVSLRLPIVIVDRGSEATRSAVYDAIHELSDAMAIAIVTERPTWWESVGFQAAAELGPGSARGPLR